jgi:hypothetical protein
VSGVVSLEDAAGMAMELPEVTEGARWGNRTWLVGKKGFAWERPLNKADVKRFGDAPVPEGLIFAVRVEDMHEKEAVLEAGTKGVFTIEHFNNYPAVLIQLKLIGKRNLRELIVNAWLACAPAKLAKEYVAAHPSLRR